MMSSLVSPLAHNASVAVKKHTGRTHPDTHIATGVQFTATISSNLNLSQKVKEIDKNLDAEHKLQYSEYVSDKCLTNDARQEV